METFLNYRHSPRNKIITQSQIPIDKIFITLASNPQSFKK